MIIKEEWYIVATRGLANVIKCRQSEISKIKKDLAKKGYKTVEIYKFCSNERCLFNKINE